MNGPDHLEILEPVGVDHGTFVARDTSTGPARLVVVERVAGASAVPAARRELLRRGHALKALGHPKVVRVRDVLERDSDLLVVSDYVDGEWLSSLLTPPRPPLGVMLRVVVDVLEGLAALHVLRDESDQPLGFVHGALGPDTVLVAEEGVAEIARACRLPRPGPNERYVAPELRRGNHPPDVSGDVYAVGSILRDVLAEAPSDEAWAEPLTEIAWRGCSVDPESRWPSALAMATTVRRVAGSRLATTLAVAEFMRRTFGEKMRARRATLEAVQEESPPPSSSPLSLSASEMVPVDPSKESTLAEALAPVRRTPPPPPRTLPPPRISPSKDAPPSRAPRLSLPPPTIVPGDEPQVLESHRRRMATFPMFEGEAQRRRRLTIEGIGVGGAILIAFATGWWVGRNHAPAVTGEPALSSVVLPSAPTPDPPPAAPATAASVASAGPAVSMASATPRAIASATTLPAPASTSAPARASTAHATAAPASEGTAPASPEPKPNATHGGYVPEEL